MARYDVIIKTSLDSKGLKSGQREHTSTFEKIAADAEKAAKREAAAFEKSARDRTIAEQRAAKEVERINQQTTRQADQQARIQERAAKQLADNKMRLVKREQDEFLRAEAVKTAAAQRAAAAQVAAAERSKAEMIAIWGAVKNAALLAFAGIAAAGAGLGLAISKAMSFDLLERGLQIVAGSAEAAQKQLLTLKELARLPGLGLRQAIEAAIALQIGFQTSIKDTTTRMQLSQSVIKQFSNAIALTGGGPEVFQRVITQLTQMSNAGKVLMTDLRPIIQAAPALGQSLVKAFGTISPEEINALGLSSEQFMRKWLAALETLPRATESASNAWTNFTQTFDQALVKLGKPFLEPLTRGLNALEPLLDSLGTKVGEIFTMLGTDAAKLWADLPTSTKAAFADMLATVTDAGGQIVKWFTDNYPHMLEAATNILNQIAKLWQEHGTTLKTNLQLALDQLKNVLDLGLNVLKGDWNAVGQDIVSILANNGKRLLAMLEQNMNLIQAAIKTAIPIVGRIAYGIGVAIAEGVWEGIKSSDTASRIKQWALDMANEARKALLIRSPSLVFFQIGTQISEGLALGIDSGRDRVHQSIADLTNFARLGFTTRDRRVGNKPQEDAAKKIADELSRQSQAINELAGKETEVQRINRLLADPNVARIIDQRTAAILRQNAAIEDSVAAASGATRPRFAGVRGQTRPRQVGGDAVENQVTATYASILANLNGQIQENVALTHAQLAVQSLEAAGLTDLSDARAQEIIALGQQLDQQEQLINMRERIRGVASDISSIFARAVEDWSGSFGDFFHNVADGFADMIRHMVASTVYSGLQNVFQNLLGKMMGLPTQGGGSFNTGGFAGGPGAGGILGGGSGGIGGIVSRLFGGSSGGGITAPASLSALAAGGGIAGLGGLLAGGGGAAGIGAGIAGAGAGIGVGGLLGGFGPALGAIAPLLGLTLGAGLGKSSGLGTILGGAGGLIGGGIGAAFLAPSLFAATGALGSMGPMLAGLLTNPFTAVVAGGLLVGALILGKNAQRRKEEKVRDAASTTTLGQIYQLLDAAPHLGLSAAKTQFEQIHQAYLSSIAGIKDSKTKRHALLWWDYVAGTAVDPGGATVAIWPRIEAAAKAGEQAAKRTSDFQPTFKHGGVFNSDFFIPRAARGLMELPGAFDRRDDLLMRVSRGEKVAVMTPDQFDRIGGRRTFEQAGVPALATGGSSPSTTTSRSRGNGDIVINANNDATAALLKLVLGGLKSADGRQIIVNTARSNVRDQDELYGDIKQRLMTGR